MDTDTITILGVDPSSTMVGFCYMNIELPTGRIVHTLAWSLDLHRTDYYSAPNAECVGDRVERIHALYKYIIDFLPSYSPDFIVCESPFSNIKFPQAGLTLSEVFSSIKLAIGHWNPCKTMYMLPPKSAKKELGDANADKTKMKNLVRGILPHINLSKDIGYESIDEHAIDAIAVAYTRYKRMCF